MTTREWIRTKLPDFLVSNKIIDNNLELKNVSKESVVNEKDEDLMKGIRLAYAECLLYILRLPTSISQGGFSLSSVDKEHYQNELKAIFINYGMEDQLQEIIKKPDITNAGEWY